MAQTVLIDAQNAICWLAVWKEGRSWNIKAFWPAYNEHNNRFEEVEDCDLDELRNISEIDPNAIFINGYYFNLGSLEEMTRESLAAAIKWHYEKLYDAQLTDALISLCEAHN